MDLAAPPHPARIATGAFLLALAAMAIASLAALTASASAAPARFVYEVCDSSLPGGGVPAGTGFVGEAPLTPFDSCASPGGAIGIEITGSFTGKFSYWSIPVANTPGGYVESLAVSAAAANLQGPNDDTFVYEQGWPPNGAGESQRIFQVASAPSIFGAGAGFTIVMNCNQNKGGCSAGPIVYGHYFAATEVDPVAPRLTNLRGSLLAGGVIRGHQTLAADARDQGGGLSSVAVSVNGLPAGAPKALPCATTYTDNPSVKGTVADSPTPCPSATSAEWTLDTEAFPFHDGENTVAVCASDFSTLGDPNTTCTPVRTVDVDNSCANSEVAGGEVLSAQFSRSGGEDITVPYEKGAEVAGRLADNAGDPIRGATICLKSQTLGVDPNAAAIATVKTDGTGHYAYQVPPGPNRELTVGYRHDSVQVAREVRFYSHSRPTLKLHPSRVRNGKRIRLWGSLPGPNAGGRVVVLQASALHSRRWLTFLRATADAHGHFHSRYRFTATTRSATYRIRALVPDQADYPWQEGHSKPVRVRVRG
jgi:hypothetical protein